ncbi:MAG: TRAP transporter TatT component family protein [Nannocystaceae bacterium]|nr:TRAP transporter TatT component family protein [Nannocystaceae bacterium]
MTRTLPLTFLSTVLLACAGRQPQWHTQPAPQQAQAAQADEVPTNADALGDARWAERTDAQAVREAIAHWERVTEAEPNNAAVLVKLTHAYYFLADGYLREDEDAYLEALEAGVRWGERAMLAASPEFAAAMAEDTKYTDAVARVGPAGVPAMFWYGTALGKWAKKQGFAVMLRHKDNIKVTMERVLTLDPTFLGGAPHTYFGVYYAVAPPIAGGDLEKSREHFEAALAISPDVLSTKVLWAAELAVKTQDEATFDRLLDEVAKADANVIPRITAENKVEQQKARELQGRRDELF